MKRDEIGPLARALQARKIGFVRLTSFQEFRLRMSAERYNVQRSDLGDYDLFLSIGDMSNRFLEDRKDVDLFVFAKIPVSNVAYGEVSHLMGDQTFHYGPPLAWDESSFIRSDFTIRASFVEAAARKVQQTGLEFHVDCEVLAAAVEHAELKVEEYGDLFRAHYAARLMLRNSNRPNHGIGDLAYVGERVGYWARMLQEVLLQQRWRLQHPENEPHQLGVEELV